MIDRIDFPKRYPVPSYLMLMVMVLALAGVMIHDCTQNQIKKTIILSDISVTEYSQVHVEIQYTVTNLSNVVQEPNLMLKVYDAKGELVASSLINVIIPARSKVPLLKIIDKLIRPLNKGEKPDKVTMEVYTRKVL